MADKKQLEILLSGVEEWNRWRKENPEVKIDLRGAELQEAYLPKANLQQANLQQANLQQANLRQANLRRSKLQRADLQGAELQEAELQEAKLRRAYLRLANLERTYLQGAKIQYADLQNAKLWYASLQGADLQGAKLQQAVLQRASLRRANLQKAHLRGASLQGAVLREAILQEATLQGAKLQEVDFQRAKLQEAEFQESQLGNTLFAASTSLAQAKGLEVCTHLSPSTVDHRTLEQAHGHLPKAFLKGCGFKDWEILQARLHDPNLRPNEVIDITYEVANLRTKGPIQVNSLFISYARKDSAFVDFIEKKLDKDGIRSWRDVHHMTAGPVEQQIERAIDLNGTVLLVLSKNSLGSAWVEWEVTRAEKRQRELQIQGKDTHVLCPVAIDGTWEQSRWPGPLMHQIKKYNILDFSSWAEDRAEESYQKLKTGIAKYYGG